MSQKNYKKYANKVTSYLSVTHQYKKRIYEDIIDQLNEYGDDADPETVMGHPCQVATEFQENIEEQYFVKPNKQSYRYSKLYRSDREFMGLPFVSVNLGTMGMAKGIIAIGDVAVGVVAVGGFSLGIVSFGGMGMGLFVFGGLALAGLLGIGGVAIAGGVAMGGAAVAYHLAMGGSAVAHTLAVGGAAQSSLIAIGDDTKGLLNFYHTHYQYQGVKPLLAQSINLVDLASIGDKIQSLAPSVPKWAIKLTEWIISISN